MATSSLNESQRETLAVFDGSGVPRTTTEVAESLETGRRSTYERLDRLVDAGELETKKVGANARVWWRPRASPVGVDGHAQFESLVDAVEEYAIFLLDSDGHVRSWNAGAERIKGYTADEILGEHVSTFYTAADEADDVPQRNLEAAAEDGETEDEGWRVRENGTRFWATVTITAIRDEAGDLVGFTKVTRDRTERRHYEEGLRQQRDFIRQVLETAPAGVIVLEPDGSFLAVNERANELLGLEDSGGHSVGVNDVYDEDGERLPPEERPYVRVFETGEPVRNVHLAVPTSDGGRRWLSTNVEPLTSDDGTVEQALVTVEDVTRLKAQARRLERQRDDLEREVDEVLERVAAGFVALDESFRFTYVNDRASELLGRPRDELVGEHVRAALPPVDPRTEARFEAAMESQESVSFETYVEAFEYWLEIGIHPSASGLSVYFRDVTDRKERERQLERYVDIIDAVGEPVYELDADGRFTFVNEPFLERTGYEEADLLGAHASVVVDDADVDRIESRMAARLTAGEERDFTVQYDLVTADGERLPTENHIMMVTDGEGRVRGSTGVMRDIGDRRERQRQLELYETIVSTMEDGVYVLDESFRFSFVNEAYAEMTGYERQELLGEHCSLVVDDDVVRESARRLWEIAAGNESGAAIEAGLQRADGTRLPAESRFTALPTDDDETLQEVGVARDISERVERERELQTRVDQQTVVTELGQQALEDRDPDALMAAATSSLTETLGTDYAKVLELDADAEELLLREGVGWKDGLVGSATVSAVENDSQAAYTLESKEPVVVEDLDTETRFSGPDLLRDHDVSGGISTIVGSYDDPWGILGTHDTNRTGFSEADVNFVQSVANVLATEIDRHEDERKLKRQREQLAALNSLNEVVNDITDAVIEQSTRAEIETAVCEGLAGPDAFSFAWIGEVDSTSRTVEPRTQVGADGYLEDVHIPIDPHDERSQGPTGQAVLTGEMQVVDDSAADERLDPWRDRVERHDVRSSAAIPVVHGGTTYGVLNVYAERRHAFTEAERRVLANLGEVVGHAIASIERKRALMSDEVVELEFRITDIFEKLGVEGRWDGRITLDQAVPAGDDGYLVYGTATDGGRKAIDAIVDVLPHWKRVSDVGTWEGLDRFELQLNAPPVLSVIASQGGYVDNAVIEDGDYTMVVHLPPTVDVRSITDTVTGAYPSADLLAQRQFSRRNDAVSVLERLLEEELTDRQRATLEAAYHAGYFEWPRQNDGEDVAESMGVSPPTFHQHLRKAERKVLESVLTKSSLGEAVADGARGGT